MIRYDTDCITCKHRHDTTWGDMGIITDGTADNMYIEICGFYNEEIDENLKQKCFEEKRGYEQSTLDKIMDSL